LKIECFEDFRGLSISQSVKNEILNSESMICNLTFGWDEHVAMAQKTLKADY
jgi:hypothetical protein